MSARKQRVGVVSLGCAKNLVDTEVMLGHLDRAECELVTDADEADVLLVNTCSFIGPAREESIEAILEAAEQKKQGKVRRVVVAGCLVQRYREELADSLPEVDAFIGLDELDRVGAAVREGHQALPVVAPSGPEPRTLDGANRPERATYLYDHATPRKLATRPWTAYLKIAEGCDHTCSFCAIPSFRGLFRSRGVDDIVSEAERLATEGVREVNLIAQDSSHYGRDLGLRDGLATLLEGLDGVEALRWVRVHYLYPNTVTQHLVDTMARLQRVVPYVDMPLQHAHPETLRRMRRGGSAESHLRLLDRFRHAMPGGALRSTFIVGFPGETDAEFQALLDFLEAARFRHVGIFVYSHEEGTTAGELVDDVPEAVKRERHARAMELQQRIAFEHAEAAVGRTTEVLVEGVHPDTEWLLVGRESTQAPDVDGQVLINDGSAEPGSFVEVELTETAGYDVVGRIAGS